MDYSPRSTQKNIPGTSVGYYLQVMEKWRREEKGMTENEMVGWHHRLDGPEFKSRSWWWTGRPGVLQSMGSQRVGRDWVTELNWTEKEQKTHSFFTLFHIDVTFVVACLVTQSCPTLLEQAHQAPLSMGFSRQASGSGLPFPAPGDHPNPGTEPTADEFFTTESLGSPLTEP